MFSSSKKGYTKEEVDAYIKKLKNQYELQLAEQKDRIFELKKQLTSHEKKLMEAKSKDELISKAIMNAVQKAEEIERIASEKYEMELEQLKAFHARWLKYYDQILRQYPLDEELIKISEKNKKISKAFAKNKPMALNDLQFEDDEAQQMYEDERARLKTGGANLEALARAINDEQEDERFEDFFYKLSGTQKKKPFSPIDNIKEYLDAQTEEFDYEEAQNPKDSLETIMRDLGFLDDDL